MSTTTYCAFGVGELLVGLPLADVSEVVSFDWVTPVPGAASGVLGIVNLRGRILTAVDLRSVLGQEPADPDTPGLHVIVHVDSEDVSMRVDEQRDVRMVDSEDAVGCPLSLDARVRSVASGLTAVDDGLLLLLDAHRALSSLSRKES
jgi:purine-binding chemotaxis protein CheW